MLEKLDGILSILGSSVSTCSIGWQLCSVAYFEEPSLVHCLPLPRQSVVIVSTYVESFHSLVWKMLNYWLLIRALLQQGYAYGTKKLQLLHNESSRRGTTSNFKSEAIKSLLHHFRQCLQMNNMLMNLNKISTILSWEVVVFKCVWQCI